VTCGGVVRNGGVCYRSCDGRVVISNISSFGGVGCHQGSSVDGQHHVYCLWILSVSDNWADDHDNWADDRRHSLPQTDGDDVASIVLTLPSDNLSTDCLRVRRSGN